MDGVPGEVLSVSLHGFCDASVDAYAAVVYMYLKTTEGVHLKFVTSKTRVAPLVKQTIPRLEPLCALILARLVTHVRQALSEFAEVAYIRCWADSEVALHWICGEAREWKQFVQNRVLEIRSLVPPEAWSYCATKDNPADIPSRGTTPARLLTSMWFSGPEWLKQYDESVPRPFNLARKPPVESLHEAKARSQPESEEETSLLQVTCGQVQVGDVVDCRRFSSLDKLLQVTALVLKFVDKLKAKSRRHQMARFQTLADYVATAEELWLKDIQSQLTSKSKFVNWKREFGVLQDGRGVLRCGGRLHNAELTETQRHPAMLDPEHYVTSLIVRHCHERVKHNGVKETLTELRSRFWIVRGRQVVRKLLHECKLCRRHEGKPFSPPDPPALPPFRTTISHPFTYTGVDFAGPLFVKQPQGSDKVYISLYTCGVSRAIHLDIVQDLTAEAFIRSFRRFAARRGLPREMKSDNRKTFKSASKCLTALFDLPEVRKHFSERRVRWTFNLEKAPWWGGFFERLIKSVKRCLKKTLGNARLTCEELYTVLLEIEATLNSRPLTFVSTEDVEEPLTPSHLLTGRRLLSLPDEEPDRDGVEGHSPTRRVNYLKKLQDHFWQRWTREYFLELRNAHRLKSRPPETEPICAGDVVIVHDDNKRRGSWNLGKVEGLITGRDGAIRGAVVKKVTEKHGRTSLLRRPLQKLYPLEHGVDHAVQDTDAARQEPLPQEPQQRPVQAVQCKEETSVADANDGAESSGQEDCRSHDGIANSRHRRAAAVEAQKRFKTWLS